MSVNQQIELIRGIARTLMLLTIIGSFCYLAISVQSESLTSALVGVVTLALKSWFDERSLLLQQQQRRDGEAK